MKLYIRNDKYVYTRTKTIVKEDTGDKLILFAGLYHEKKQLLGNSHRKKLIPSHYESMELDFVESESFSDIPMGYHKYILSESEYKMGCRLVDEQGDILFRLIENLPEKSN